MLAFAIPSRCPSSTPLSCSHPQEDVDSSVPEIIKTNEAEMDGVRTHKRARVHLGTKATPECESSVRRSDRIKAKNKGFHKSPCQDNACLACNARPPTITTEVIQSLGTKVCALDSSKVYSEKLLSNPGSQTPIGKLMGRRRTEASSKGKEILSETSSNSSAGA
uniref:Uncharacterized protein n=1 Tax=Setaria viridis TaxID=4556 RepID=A0A4U6VU66_SETVI|nr:hypothetical protein SEVIR_2G157200v2 [Setaria viridis]